MKRIVILFCAAFLSGLADGATVEVSTEGWTGSGVTNGWTFANLGEPFPDGAARLGDGAWIASPTWPKAKILSATVTVECPTNAPGGYPQITFLYDDGQPTKPIQLSAVMNADATEVQTCDATPSRVARGVRISSGEGACGKWGICAIALLAKGSFDTDAQKTGLAVLIR